MTLAQMIRRPCVVLARSDAATEDVYGNVGQAEAAVETLGEFQPRSAVEPDLAGELSDEDWVGFFFPADIPNLTTASGVWVPELGEFEVLGRPAAWWNSHVMDNEYVQANLKRTAGSEDDLS